MGIAAGNYIDASDWFFDYAADSSSSSGFTTTETVTDTITIPVLNGESYLIEFNGIYNSTVAGDVMQGRIRLTSTAGTSLIDGCIYIGTTARYYQWGTRVIWMATSNTNQTFVVTGIRSVGSGTITRYGSATNKSLLTVKVLP